MTAAQPIDELGATTRRRLILLDVFGQVQYQDVPAERDPAAVSDLLFYPPCSVEGLKRLILEVQHFRRGEEEPYEVVQHTRDIEHGGDQITSVTLERQ